MVRLNMIVEGLTEQVFARDVMMPHLAQEQVYISARRIETGRRGPRIFRGGMTDYHRARQDIRRWLKQDKQGEVRLTTMFDLYALPDDFPGYAEAKQILDPYQRVETLEQHLGDDIDDPRFIPHIQLHEFEALLFSAPEQFAVSFPDCEKQIGVLCAIATQFPSPEHIDDDEHGAPSKRIANELPGYLRRKTTAGPRIAQAIGLAAIREKCTHFGKWIETLEELGQC